METGEDFAVVPDTQGASVPSSTGFPPPRPPHFAHGMHIGDPAYLSHFAPKPFQFEGAGARSQPRQSDSSSCFLSCMAVQAVLLGSVVSCGIL